ncbi:hypothetical protein ACLB2K_060395 [Fragaria x ananassa]
MEDYMDFLRVSWWNKGDGLIQNTKEKLISSFINLTRKQFRSLKAAMESIGTEAFEATNVDSHSQTSSSKSPRRSSDQKTTQAPVLNFSDPPKEVQVSHGVRNPEPQVPHHFDPRSVIEQQHSADTDSSDDNAPRTFVTSRRRLLTIYKCVLNADIWVKRPGGTFLVVVVEKLEAGRQYYSYMARGWVQPVDIPLPPWPDRLSVQYSSYKRSKYIEETKKFPEFAVLDENVISVWHAYYKSVDLTKDQKDQLSGNLADHMYGKDSVGTTLNRLIDDPERRKEELGEFLKLLGMLYALTMDKEEFDFEIELRRYLNFEVQC